MSRLRMIRPILREYGMGWSVNRARYVARIKAMGIVPSIEKRYEKKTAYPSRLDLFSIDVEALRRFLMERLSDEDKARLIETADKACKGVLVGFSSIELDYGNPLDWQLNPLTGKRCDAGLKWYRIPDFDADRGDVKVIWEASRFSHFITLARAFLLNGDEKYHKAFSSQLKDWLEENPYGFGANFKCGQECGFRMVNALLAYAVFRDGGAATDADASNVKDLVDRCYRKILGNFFYAYKCIRNNHTISELMGAIVGAWCCEDQKRLEKGYRLLDKTIGEQFTEDGGYKQFSFNYQRLALQDLEVVLSISAKTQRELNDRSKEKIRNAAALMYQCQDESGDVPNYGSNDGALVFPVTNCGYRDFRPVINTAYALTSGNQLYSPDKHQEELIWFSAGKGLEERQVKSVDRVSSQFLNAGLFTLRGQNSWAMIVSNDYHSRPAHMDQLHFDLWIDGVNVMCDAGTFSYACEEGRRLARNDSHNTAVVEGVAQMSSSGPFMIYDWTKRELGECSETRFKGKCVSANGYTHSREVKRTGTSYEITDQVDRDYQVLFHTPCDVSLRDGKAVLSINGKTLCEVICEGEFKIQSSQRSLYYLAKEDVRCLSISGRAGAAIKTIIEIKGEMKP